MESSKYQDNYLKDFDLNEEINISNDDVKS